MKFHRIEAIIAIIFSVEKLGIASIFFDGELFRSIVRKLSNPDVKNTDLINCAANLANALIMPNWIIMVIVDDEKHEISTVSVQEFIEMCHLLLRIIPQNHQNTLIKKLIFHCFYYKVSLSDEQNEFIEKSNEYSVVMTVLEAKKPHDLPEHIDQIKTCLTNWLIYLQKYPWKRPPITELEQKTKELTSFVKSASKHHFKTTEAFELLKQVKKNLYKSRQFAFCWSLVEIASFEVDDFEEECKKTLKVIFEGLTFQCNGLTPTSQRFYYLLIDAIYLESNMDNKGAFRRLTKLKKEAIEFVKTTSRNHHLGIKLLQAIARAENDFGAADRALNTLSSIQSILEKKIKTASPVMVDKCCSFFPRLLSLQTQFDPSSSLDKLKQLDKIIVDQFTHTLKRKKSHSLRSSRPLKKQKITNSQLQQLRIPIYETFLEINKKKSSQQRTEVAPLISRVNQDCGETSTVFARSVDRSALAVSLLTYDKLMAWPIIASIEEPCNQAQLMILFKQSLEKK